MVELRIDPEFQGKIPPLTEAEFQQLQENILADGEVYEPIAVWNGVIVDGHNRWKIVQQHPEIPYRVRELKFADKWEAFEWMYCKQLGRRNLTEEQKSYMIGKMYEARKQSIGGQIGHKGSNEYSNPESAESDKMSTLPTRREIKDGTAGQIGRELGIDSRTVRRAEKFAKGVDVLKETSPETANAILQGGTGIPKEFIASIPFMEEEQKEAGIKAVIEGADAVSEFRQKEKEKPKEIAIGSSAYNNEDFRDQVSAFPKDLDDTLRIFLMSHGDMLSKRACRREFRLMLNEIKKVVQKYWEVVNEH